MRSFPSSPIIDKIYVNEVSDIWGMKYKDNTTEENGRERARKKKRIKNKE